jgi:hypothetical protein
MVDTEDVETVDVDELRPQFIEAFEGADYPVTNPMDLLPGLPDGPATSFESNGVEFSVLEMQSLDNGVDVDLDAEPDVPYESVESLVDDLCAGIREAQEKL